MNAADRLNAAKQAAQQAAAELRLAEALKKRNDKFRALSPAKKRVAIAEDVLAQLKTSRFVAASSYFATSGKALYKHGDKQLCDVRDQIRCEACGIGSLMVAACGFVNNLTLGEAYYYNQGEVRDYLSEWFDEDQLALIESWFEHRPDGAPLNVSSWTPTPPKGHPITRFRSARDRLTAIMQNIVSNNGTFDPTRGKHAGPVVEE